MGVGAYKVLYSTTVKLALLDIPYCLSQGRYLIHMCIVRKELNICIVVATLTCIWLCKVSTRTGLPGVRTLWPDEIAGLICNFSVWQHVQLPKQTCPWDRLVHCWDVQQPTNNKPASCYPNHTSFCLVSERSILTSFGSFLLHSVCRFLQQVMETKETKKRFNLKITVFEI